MTVAPLVRLGCATAKPLIHRYSQHELLPNPSLNQGRNGLPPRPPISFWPSVVPPMRSGCFDRWAPQTTTLRFEFNDQRRICFVRTEVGPADVEIVDYH